MANVQGVWYPNGRKFQQVAKAPAWARPERAARAPREKKKKYITVTVKIVTEVEDNGDRYIPFKGSAQEVMTALREVGLISDAPL